MTRLLLQYFKVIPYSRLISSSHFYPHQAKGYKLISSFSTSRFGWKQVNMANFASSPVILRVISSSVAVAKRAGKIIRDVMSKGDLGIVDKGINDLQTEADRSAQKCIVDSLARQFPKTKIIGEETLDPTDKIDENFIESKYDDDVLKHTCPNELAKINEEQIVIWVDPLDGTSEYTQGLLEHVTVLIGIAVNGRAVGGIIHQPFYNYKEKGAVIGRTIWGLLGLGAFGHTVGHPPADKRIVTTTRSHSNKLVQSAIDALKPDEVVKVGGAGHKVLLLIEGRAHAYIFASPGCKKWDTCAPEAVLHSLGGKLTDIHGTDLQYHQDVKHPNSTGVLATFDAKEHPWYVNNIPEEVKNSLKSSSL